MVYVSKVSGASCQPGRMETGVFLYGKALLYRNPHGITVFSHSHRNTGAAGGRERTGSSRGGRRDGRPEDQCIYSVSAGSIGTDHGTLRRSEYGSGEI